jgi:transcriptional regulator with XRE-family HTH domain
VTIWIETEDAMLHAKSNRIPERELLSYRAEVKGEIFRQIRQRLRLLQEEGLTQKDLADRLGMDPGLLSRRLKGEQDMRLETLSDLARGLDCRIDVSLVPVTQVFLSIDNQAQTQAQALPIQYLPFGDVVSAPATLCRNGSNSIFDHNMSYSIFSHDMNYATSFSNANYSTSCGSTNYDAIDYNTNCNTVSYGTSHGLGSGMTLMMGAEINTMTASLYVGAGASITASPGGSCAYSYHPFFLQSSGVQQQEQSLFTTEGGGLANNGTITLTQGMR